MLNLKVKRNISAILAAVGVICVIARLWNVIKEPHSSRGWFELSGMIILTYLCIDSWWIYRRKITAEESKSEQDGK